MGLGLWIDTLHTPAALLANECGAPGSLLDMARRHATLMPFSSAAMVLAALVPWTRGRAWPTGERLLGALLMTMGMVLGARLGAMAALAWGAPAFAAMVLGMGLGMGLATASAIALGMLLAVAMDRLRNGETRRP